MGRNGHAFSEGADLNHCSAALLTDTLLRQNVRKQTIHVNFEKILLLSVQEATGLK
jgi:alpha-D-ribose 1-methylphosphonate 5-triphosphate synthase subunit PhnG